MSAKMHKAIDFPDCARTVQSLHRELCAKRLPLSLDDYQMAVPKP